MFPYCSLVVESGNTNPADFLLACTTRGVCDAYQNVILNIPRLSTNSTKQLITDIGETILKISYFCCQNIDRGDCQLLLYAYGGSKVIKTIQKGQVSNNIHRRRVVSMPTSHAKGHWF